MHDVHVVQGLIAHLLEAEPGGVGEVRIRVGPLRSRESLELAYRMLTPGTALEGSRLVIERSTEEASCPSCGGAVTAEDLAGHLLLCPSCLAATPSAAEPIEVVGIARRIPASGLGPSALPC